VKRDLVVVGASAGGVRALRTLAAGLPADLPAAVCVVLHIGSHPSSLAELMASAGPLPASLARHGELLRPGHVFVAPPDHHLLVEGGQLRLSRGPKEHHARPAVDPLFRSAALHAGPRAIGVVLSGRLDDGTAGLAAVKVCGGLAVVQDPAEAESPGMPRSALDFVAVDHCLPVAQIGPLLGRLVRENVAQPHPLPPQRLVDEHMASQGQENALSELTAIASPSTLSCPECNGTLWEVDGSVPPRFRCHTGHGYSLRTLAESQQAGTEDALWSAVRALQEKEVVARRMAELDRLGGDPARAEAGEADADRLRRQADVLRRIAEAETHAGGTERRSLPE
jgi:two-component system chemotaxis response regulator CheB